MTYCYTHRWAPHITPIWKTFPQIRWWTQRPTTGWGADSELLWSTQLWMGDLYQTPPTKVQESTWKKRWKDHKNQRRGTTPRKQYFLDTTGLIYMWAHRDCDKAQRPAHVQSKLPALRREHRHTFPLVNKKVFVPDTCWERKSSVFSSGT